MNANELDLEALVGPHEWADCGTKVYVRCPGHDRHTTRTGRRDTLLYLEGAPTIFCLHQQCRELVDQTNANLRKALKAMGWNPPDMTPEYRARARRERHWELQAKRLSDPTARNFVYESMLWDVENSLTAEAYRIMRPAHQWRAFLNHLFEPDDNLWHGEPFQSGHADNVMQFDVAGRLATCPPSAQFIAPNPFQPDTYARKTENLSDRKYFVVECDTASENPEENRLRCGAVFRYAERVQPLMRLAAVVDSGNKSLHGWFEYPCEEVYSWAKAVLPALGADPATMRLAQPVRAPGAFRDNGAVQHLLWLKGDAQ